jgi:hypothetical protein
MPLIDIRKPSKSKSRAGKGGKGERDDNILEKNTSKTSTRPKNLQSDKYYTLSKKGFTTFYKEEPIEFVALHEWIKDRRYYQ